MHPDMPYPDWRNVIWGIQDAALPDETRRQIAYDWTSAHARRPGHDQPSAVDALFEWSNAHPGTNRVRLATLVKMAQDAGWNPEPPRDDRDPNEIFAEALKAEKKKDGGRQYYEGLTYRCASDVSSEAILWTWRNRLARGKLNIFAGNPDEGKTTIAIDVAARVSKGLPWPMGEGTAEQGAILDGLIGRSRSIENNTPQNF
jgi:hypothetical protein